MMKAQKTKKVLLISYAFPPDNAIGAVRISKFAKYLPEFGWEPIILTVEGIKHLSKTLPLEISEQQIIRVAHYSRYDLLAKIFKLDANFPSSSLGQDSNKGKKQKSIISKILRPFRTLYTIPIIQKAFFDPMGWYRPAIKAALEVLKNKNIDIIFSSFNPSTSHIIASHLNKQTKIPWVAEFRDHWSLNPYNRHIQPFYLLEQLWEKRTLNNSAQIIAVSDLWAKEMEKFHSKNIIVIPNGFDEEDYLEQIASIPKFTITYTGRIYPGKRDPTPLFQAIAALVTEGKISDQDIEVRFFGQNMNEMVSGLIEEYHLEKIVKCGGFIGFRESIKRQMESTVLLLLSWNNAKDSGSICAKIYEYMGARRPILAQAFEGGEIDKLLQETQCGIVANNVIDIKNVILKWFEEFKTTGSIHTYFRPNIDIVKKYTRKEQAKSLAIVFDKYSL